MEARRAAELAARHSYGRLVAYLAVQSRSIAAAEDALGDAFLTALNTWPERGVPAKPEAWLLTTARRKLIDAGRHAQVKTAALPQLEQMAQNLQEATMMETPFPDERLKLLFLCAHPAIDPGIRTPLMLQTVLGLTATEIASTFLVAPATMGQRLVRAKTKIRDAGIPFELPVAEHLPARLEAVLEAIYAAYNRGWETVNGAAPLNRGLTAEAIWLARLCVQLMPQEPEARGLLALMLYCEARRQARYGQDGAYIPLSEQDPHRWNQAMLQDSEAALRQAAQAQVVGRFQLEAAIQSVHVQQRVTGRTDWSALVQLYDGLVQLCPTVGAWVGRAAALAEVNGAQTALLELELLPLEQVRTYQPYWALRAHLLKQLGALDAARHAYGQAIGLAEDDGVRTFLMTQLSQLP